jgi:catalase (peroxidase I)
MLPPNARAAARDGEKRFPYSSNNPPNNFKKKKNKNLMFSIVKTYGGIPERIQSLKLYFI